MTAPQKERTQPGGAGSLDALTWSAGDNNHIRLPVDREQARLLLEILSGAGAVYEFRALHRVLRPYSFTGTLDEVGDQLAAANEQGYGIFVVINEGGRKKGDITSVRAVFADIDNAEAWKRILDDPAALQVAGRDPHLIVETSPGKGHVYWKTNGLPLEKFSEVQKAIAARYGGDPSVADLSRVMRVPGFMHTKAAPQHTSIVDARSSDPAFTADEILAAFSPSPASPPTPPAIGLAFSPLAQFGHFGDVGRVVNENRHGDLLVVAGQLARRVHFDGWGRSAALAALFEMRNSGRWTRDMPDSEIVASLDDGIEKCRSGEWRELAAANDPIFPAVAPLAEAVARELRPFTDEDFAKASVAHPHVFERGDAGIFPIGEVTIVAAPGREGKTYAMVHLAAACALGHAVGGLSCSPRRVLIYSNEDDRTQYARKTLAICSRLHPDDVTRLRGGLLVPDLEVPGLVEARAIVGISERRRPVPTEMVAALIAAVRPLVEEPGGVGLIIFETASTLSDADEDNPGLKTLVAALKQIARELGVAVVLVHHTSQAAALNLPSLNISVADIRGGTALAFNTRQCFMLVNMGSNDDPFPDKDMRTLLRAYVAPYAPGRVTALICLDSSKSVDPPPIFLSWVPTPAGPALVEVKVPEDIDGARWRKVRQVVRAWASKERDEAKSEKEAADVLACIETATRLHAEGKHPTVRAISIALGHGADWAKPRLECAVKGKRLIQTEEEVPKTGGKTSVFRPAQPAKVDAFVDPVGADDIADDFDNCGGNAGFDPSDGSD